jgi:hypothetical protein
MADTTSLLPAELCGMLREIHSMLLETHAHAASVDVQVGQLRADNGAIDARLRAAVRARRGLHRSRRSRRLSPRCSARRVNFSGAWRVACHRASGFSSLLPSSATCAC